MKTEILKKSIPVALSLFILLSLVSGVAGAAAQPSSLVEPTQLKKWIDNGYKTEKGDRVVIVDVLPGEGDRETWFSGDAKKLKLDQPAIQQEQIDQLDKKGLLGHIPGALFLTSHDGEEVAARSDGPIKTEHEVAAGAELDAMLRGLGITRDEVVVITSAKNSWCGPRLWWTLSYWGFSSEKIKLLNGGNKAFALAGYALRKGMEKPAVTPSTISVAELSPKQHDMRVSLGQMISLVDSAKTVNGTVYLLDARQPPAAFYLKDERKADGTPGSDDVPDIYQLPGFSYDPANKLFTRQSDKAVFVLSQIFFSSTANDGKTPRFRFNPMVTPPLPIPNPYLAMHSTAAADHLAIPIGKSIAFEGIIKGAHLIKTEDYNITIPALLGSDNRYKSREELLALFAKAGIDGTKPVVLYCNSGASSSFYFYALHEICGFKNVRMYDGSWTEWSNLTAFEPADASYVRRDMDTVYPAYPSLMPSLLVFAGRNNYLEWDGKQFIDAVTGKPTTPSQVKPGGSLRGNLRWDTLHRSEHVVFRASEKVNNPKQYRTHNSDTDWLDVDTIPDYAGDGNKILMEDQSYAGALRDSTAMKEREQRQYQ